MLRLLANNSRFSKSLIFSSQRSFYKHSKSTVPKQKPSFSERIRSSSADKSSISSVDKSAFPREFQRLLTDAYNMGKFKAVEDPKWALRIIDPFAAVYSKIASLHSLAVLIFTGAIVYWLYESVSVTSGSSGLNESEDDMQDPMQSILNTYKNQDEPVEHPTTKFDDVRGLGEIREALEDVCDYLRNTSKYTAIGVSAPKGVLLSGPPGCGKTLLGRALAGECEVPFYFVESSSVDGMYVGTGAKRIEKLFQQARKHPEGAIIFFDEIDAIGGQRSTTASMNPYSRQTINKLLNEMDGFKSDDKILVIGSTNMPDVLDKALVRSGRFDQRLDVPSPVKDDRIELLEYYLDKVQAAEDIDMEYFGKITAGIHSGLGLFFFDN